ncbi:probable receptor-like protein kinase At1g30570 [Telopea speciosissima]|uniref:probable receptor-like protein kinase At1g30570 n=1 Tax=Telopea speciosissima TaxID=54955 RepID=UPI001CC6A5AE|nr:probable receptor-like protein kinase At1g30570 [Telopea speciosissima]
MHCTGLASLQKRLLKDIFKVDFDINHYHRGKKLIKRMLCKENVLLVLDDVDSKEQVDALANKHSWFGAGSRVIIITRDEHILNVAKVDKDKIYWPQVLNCAESLQLFSLHAFSMDEPPLEYVKLSHDMVLYSGGLPSILEVLGSYLLDISNKEEWKSTLRKLKTGQTSISSLASLRSKRKNTCPIKDNPLGWRPQLHGTIGISNTVARVSKVLEGCLDLNGFIASDIVGNKCFTTVEIRAGISKFTGGYLNPNDSTVTDRVDKRFRIAEIRAATKNFDESLVIGVGGFGRVYKGVMDDGTLAAFKRAKPQSIRGPAEFVIEVGMLSKLKHRDVVSMIGFCEEKNEMILVYEYMANGNLRNHLFRSDLPPLTWKQRLEICIGVARGLHYLHTGSEYGIIHRDVKPSNILLDENFVAKISDFGLSLTLDDTIFISIITGTFEYMAPEYICRGQLSKGSDVYSFGVVLFEIVLGRQCRRWRSLETIVDRRLEGNYSPKSLKKFGKIIKKCLAEKGENRPTMGEVLLDLEYVLQLHEKCFLLFDHSIGILLFDNLQNMNSGYLGKVVVSLFTRMVFLCFPCISARKERIYLPYDELECADLSEDDNSMGK